MRGCKFEAVGVSVLLSVSIIFSVNEYQHMFVIVTKCGLEC